MENQQNQAPQPHVPVQSTTSIAAPLLEQPPTQTNHIGINTQQPQQNQQPTLPISTPQPEENKSTTPVAILQWLCYAMWLWTIATLSIILSATLSYFFVPNGRAVEYTWLTYFIATLLVLLPIAFILDRIYSKKEPDHKHGFMAVIMVIHAVITFLGAVAGLITFAVTVLQLMLNSTSNSTKYIVIISSLVVATLSMVLFLRIMHFPKLSKFSKIFPIIIVSISSVTVVMALTGPFRGELASKTDRLIENNLPNVSNAIQNYATKNKKLPASLADIKLSDDAEALIDKNLVEYNNKSTGSEYYSTGNQTSSKYQQSYSYTLSYELCVTYKNVKKYNSSSYQYEDDNEGEQKYLSTYNHPAGKKCYALKATVYK